MVPFAIAGQRPDQQKHKKRGKHAPWHPCPTGATRVWSCTRHGSPADQGEKCRRDVAQGHGSTYCSMFFGAGWMLGVSSTDIPGAGPGRAAKHGQLNTEYEAAVNHLRASSPAEPRSPEEQAAQRLAGTRCQKDKIRQSRGVAGSQSLAPLVCHVQVVPRDTLGSTLEKNNKVCSGFCLWRGSPLILDESPAAVEAIRRHRYFQGTRLFRVKPTRRHRYFKGSPTIGNHTRAVARGTTSSDARNGCPTAYAAEDTLSGVPAASVSTFGRVAFHEMPDRHASVLPWSVALLLKRF